MSLSKIYKNGEVLRGIPADSCWMFKSYAEKITVYSSLASQKAVEPLVSGIQLGDEAQIVDFNHENVLKLTEGASPKVKALIDSKKLLKAGVAVQQRKSVNTNSSNIRQMNTDVE